METIGCIPEDFVWAFAALGGVGFFDGHRRNLRMAAYGG